MTSISSDGTDRFEELMVDKAALPAVYVGELVDIDGDETPDLALFGDPAHETFRALHSESDFEWAPVAVIAAGGAVGAAAMKKRDD